ncbi:hypothetical protein CAPTEDRAFT_223137 [Capitella teleta]|uniref:Uncharacterized protein n=1 Tax=Capitella teleta TaxID=283909 RepID=R7V958_CAPTE|nr:hypothetical protein CAPTEDRAFT_223137 [Capitella teleta]|eukprot:ELU12896.1 hypothetical protein CAPTEDRAFT_223137 [Capitella teleta]
MERLRKAGLLADTSSEPTPPTAQSNSTSNTSPSPLAAIINSTQASSEPTVGPDSTVTNLNSSFASSNVKNSTVANSTNSSVSVTMSSREPLLTTLDGLNSTASNASQLSSPSQNPAEVNLTPSTNASLSMRLKNFSLSNYPPWMTREVAFAWCAIAFFLLTTLAFLVVCAQKYRVCSALSCCEDCALYTQI